MKEGWKYEKLGDVASYVNGFAFKPEDWTNEGLPIIRIQNLTEQNKTFNYCKRTDIPQKYLVTDGDVLISWSATLGVFEWKRGLALLNQHIFKVVFDKIKINKQFFIYTIQTSIEEMSRHTNGATMRHIRKGDFDNIKIPLPSLSEQERIVAFLDAEFEKIDQLKANAAAQLQAAKDLFQAALKEILTPNDEWEEKKIGDACEIIGGSTPKTKDPSNWDGDYYWVTPAELTGSKYYGVTKRTITQKGAAGLRLLPIGTVLLSSRAPIGKVAITTVPMYCNQGFKNIICPNGIYNEYVYWYILYSVPQLEELGEGTTFKELSKGRLSKFILPIPPLPEQQRIAERLDAISEKVKALQSNYNQTLTLCNDLKQALLKSIFE